VVDSNDSLSQVVAELDQNGQVNVAYLYGDDLVSQYRGNDVNYYHYDGLGSTRALTDSTATVTNTYSYEAFGGLQEQTGETENNYLYTGEQIDPNTGNYYLRARYYNPVSGRFLSMDSFDGVPQDPITLHKYLYGNADPVNMVDPSGMFGLASFGVANNIRGMLTDMQIEVGLSILDAAFNPDKDVLTLTGVALGALALAGVAPKLFRLLSKKGRKPTPKACKTASSDICSKSTLTATDLNLPGVKIFRAKLTFTSDGTAIFKDVFIWAPGKSTRRKGQPGGGIKGGGFIAIFNRLKNIAREKEARIVKMSFVPGGTGVQELLERLAKKPKMRKRLGITVITKEFGTYTLIFRL
jgi:RHS repeat-associated protein